MTTITLQNPWNAHYAGCADGARDFRNGFAMRNQDMFNDPCADFSYAVNTDKPITVQRNTQAYYHKGYRTTYRAARRIYNI